MPAQGIGLLVIENPSSSSSSVSKSREPNAKLASESSRSRRIRSTNNPKDSADQLLIISKIFVAPERVHSLVGGSSKFILTISVLFLVIPVVCVVVVDP